MERSRKLLDLCRPGVKEFCMVKVLELNRFHIIEKDLVEPSSSSELSTIKLNKKEYHVIVVSNGDETTMYQLMQELIKYERVQRKYTSLSYKTEFTQTEADPNFKVSCLVEQDTQTDELCDFTQSAVDLQLSKISALSPKKQWQLTGLTAVVDNMKLLSGGGQKVTYQDLGSLDYPSTSQNFPMLPASLHNVTEGPNVQDIIEDNSSDDMLQDNRTLQVEKLQELGQFSCNVQELIPSENSTNQEICLEEPQGQTSGDSPQQTVQKVIPKRPKKKHHCKFCHKMIGNYTRHLIQIHSNEKDVELLQQAETKYEKSSILRRIQAEGDEIYNEKHPDNPIVRRKSTKYSTKIWDKCPSCKILVSKYHAVKHLRNCERKISEKSGKAIRVDLSREKFLIHELLSPQMKKEIIPFMRNDSITKLCTEDESLILYGNKMCERLMGENQDKTIRNHLRIVGRVAEKTIKKNESIENVLQIFNPKNYDTFVQAIHDICGYGKGQGQEMRNPTTPHQYGPRMREISDYLISTLMKKKDTTKLDDNNQELLKKKIKTIESWQAIYDREFDKQVASLGRKQADRRTFDTKQITPSMGDVQKLINFIQKKTEVTYSNLLAQFSIKDYIMLSKCLLLKLWIFNRRRVGEVDKLRLKNWLEAKDIDECSDQYKTLSETEKRFATSYRRLCVQGKLRRPVALLVPKKDMACFDLIVSLREKAGISPDNIYLFGMFDRYIEGTAAMHEFARECGATNWKLLTGTRLRKQLAASLRYLNLSDEDLRLVAEAMGHTDKTHLEHYRKYDAALHAGRVSKVLMAMDEGTIQRHVGKSLDDFDNNVVLDDTIQKPSKDMECLGVELSTPGMSTIELAESPLAPTPSTSRAPDIKKESLQGTSSPSNESQASERGNSPGRKRAFSKRKMKTAKRFKWSNEIKKALQTEMADEISKKKCPSTARVLQVMGALEEDFPEIINKSPKKIKTLICNLSKKC